MSCANWDAEGEKPRIPSADKPVAAIDKGLAASGLPGLIVTGKFRTRTPLYRRMIGHVLGSHLIAAETSPSVR